MSENVNRDFGSILLADHTIGRAFATVCRLSVRDVLYCGETVCPS